MNEGNLLVINCVKPTKLQQQACMNLVREYLDEKNIGKVMALEIANRNGPHSEILSIVEGKISAENCKSIKKNEKSKEIKKKFRNFFSGGRYDAGVIISAWKDEDDFLNFLSDLGLELDHIQKGSIIMQPIVSVKLAFGNDTKSKVTEIRSFN